MGYRRRVYSTTAALLLGGLLLWWGHGTTVMGQDGPIHGTVQSSTDQTVTVELKTGYRVESGTEGTVWATKTTLGQETTVEQGKIRVEEADGRTVTAQIVEGTGLEGGQDVQFASVREVGMIVVDVQPDKATVYLDQERVGQGDVRRTVDVGLHDLSVAASGHDTKERAIEVKRGKTQSESFNLDRLMGRLTVTTTPSAAQLEYREGSFGQYIELGETPIREKELPSGTYDLRLSKQGYQMRSDEVSLEAGVLTKKSYTLRQATGRQAMGTLVVTSNPSGAGVYVDGEYIGTTRIEKEVAPVVPHEVRVTKEGYQSESYYRQVPAGATERMNLNLERVVTADNGSADASSNAGDKQSTWDKWRNAQIAGLLGAGIGAAAAGENARLGGAVGGLMVGWAIGGIYNVLSD